MGKWLLILAGAIFLIPLNGGCGVKTAPYPEAATLPNKVLHLTQAFTTEGDLMLTWYPPKKNMVGRPVKSLGGFEIEVSDNAATAEYCASCPHTYLPVDMVPITSPPPGMDMAPGPYEWGFKTKPGRVYRFRVTSVTANGGRHPKARVEIVAWALDVPGPLTDFRATMDDRAVALAWSGQTKELTAEIEKKTKGGQWYKVSGLDPAKGSYSDMSVGYGGSYIYRGRLAQIKNGSTQPGPWSRELTVKVIDLTPPNPPGYLDVALAPTGVLLKWESLIVTDTNVAGYRVYRQLSGENSFKRISPALLQDNTYLDPVQLTFNQIARYRVTAVDTSPRANESLPSPTVDVLLDPVPETPVQPR